MPQRPALRFSLDRALPRVILELQGRKMTDPRVVLIETGKRMCGQLRKALEQLRAAASYQPGSDAHLEALNAASVHFVLAAYEPARSIEFVLQALARPFIKPVPTGAPCASSRRHVHARQLLH
jgi:hypothetical protein